MAGRTSRTLIWLALPCVSFVLPGCAVLDLVCGHVTCERVEPDTYWRPVAVRIDAPYWYGHRPHRAGHASRGHAERKYAAAPPPHHADRAQPAYVETAQPKSQLPDGKTASPAASATPAPGAPSPQAGATQPAAPGKPAAGAPAATSPAGDTQLEQAIELFHTGAIEKARDALQPLVQKKHPEATLQLARTYDGLYLRLWTDSEKLADRERARALYKDAAALGANAALTDILRIDQDSDKK